MGRNIDKTLIYMEKDNYFIDLDGDVVYNIFSWITPNQLNIFKFRKKSVIVRVLDLPWRAYVRIFYEGR